MLIAMSSASAGTSASASCISTSGDEESKPQQLETESDLDLLYCGVCNKSFDKTLQYQNHMRYHRAVRKYPCVHCSKSFSQSNNLRTHLRIHTNERPFKCSQCGKAFTQVTNLNNHVRLHTGERPYVCTVSGCNRAYAQVTNLNNHRRSHQKELPYACGNCDKIFQDRGDLDSHCRFSGHFVNSTSLACLACGESFAEERLLKRHVRESCKEGGIPIRSSGKLRKEYKKQCFFNECPEKFEDVSGFNVHLSTNHGIIINRYHNYLLPKLDSRHEKTHNAERELSLFHISPEILLQRLASRQHKLSQNRERPDPELFKAQSGFSVNTNSDNLST